MIKKRITKMEVLEPHGQQADEDDLHSTSTENNINPKST